MAEINHLGDGKYRCVKPNGSITFFNVPADGNINAAHQWAVDCQNSGGKILPPPVPFLSAKSRFSGVDGDTPAPATPAASTGNNKSASKDWRKPIAYASIGLLVGVLVGVAIGRKR